jgi:putative selenate reductase molybdopterin-binding subunit
MPEGRTIGRAERRRDGVKLAAGRATFTDDVSLPGLLHARVLTSPHPHARIVRVSADAARGLAGVAAVLTHDDFPTAPRGDALFDPHLRFAGDRVAVAAAEDVDVARSACEAVDVDYEILPALLDTEAALQQGAGALAEELRAEVGDVDAAMADAQHVLQRTYRLPRATQAALEPQVALAWLDEDQRLVVRTSSHVPFEVRRVLARRLGIPLRRIRVIAPRDSGGFGGRLGVFTEDLCAALALRTGRPVRLVRPRDEELAGPRAAHGQTVTLRSGVTDGRLVALEMSIVENAGAHDEWAAAALRAAGGVLALYRCPNIRFHGRAVATHLPPAGALRGDGASQAAFALESHVDELASLIGEGPIEFRERHHVREGDEVPIWSRLAGDDGARPRVVRSCALGEALRLGAKAAGWRPVRKNGKPEGPWRRGQGVALALQSPGPLGAETTSATIDMNEDGSFLLFVGTADMDAGGDTVLCQIAAEVLSVPLEAVVAHSADTDVVPFASGPTRSSALYVSGLAVRKAAEAVRQRILDHAAQSLGADPRTLFVREGAVHSADGGRLGFDEIGRATLLGTSPRPISATSSHSTEDAPPPFAAVFAQVEVDVETGVARVLQIVEAVDCGQILHPQIAEARIEGGALQGLEYALSAPVSFDAGGQPWARTLRDYRLVTAADAPEIVTLLIPSHEPTGPFGAKSIAEIAIHGVAPAVANAVAQALGARVYELPLTPERIRAAVR